VPASGKSTYAEWLASRGWAFIDHDRVTGRTDDQRWWGLVTTRRAADFVKVVAAGDHDVVLEFGFPIGLLPDVRRLKAAGAQHWWFEADHQTAREAFNARNELRIRQGRRALLVPIEAFEKYVGDITTHRDEIRSLFRPKIIETLLVGGTRLPVEEIDRQVVEGSTWSEPAPVGPPAAAKIGRNDPCWCGSGKKFKRCHGANRSC
jgi:hypothetical protein